MEYTICMEVILLNVRKEVNKKVTKLRTRQSEIIKQCRESYRRGDVVKGNCRNIRRIHR